MNGDIIYGFFDSSFITCGCTYQVCEGDKCENKSACVDVNECTALKG